MKASTVSLMIAAMFTATAGAANWSSEARDDGQTQFYVDLQGEVPQRCRMVTKQDLTMTLDLEKGQASEFKFKAWCNIDSSNGLLVVGAQPFINQNNNEDIIPLVVKFNGEQGRIDANTNAGSTENYHAISKNFTVSNATVKDMGSMNVLTVQPEVNSWEKAGKYATSMYVSLYPQ
ncbi:hypothetical protein [Shewanella sp. NIFS-20-20]|uniref:hypothetical protein n=1 Tax=Shewanella sp. NIFS-20-20 TaxID=2853806 RepID=UPI001C4493A3|nr:hypothetical protein [Shewanella sp. NIFS-20-20]MBV7315412.1 hypothetical protein [Shewanella sp. NIFS-20-20]